ncbi:hypothetical protein ABI59_16535 [Acidobacteria bacterium Mor1]|nr:hypothetical protein ABI59_16535 [Acidobacteria bacterium Mor1]
MPGKKQRLLLQIERFSRNHYKLVFLITLIAVVAAVWIGSRLKLESDVLELFPDGNPTVSAFKSAVQDFGSLEYLIVLLQAESEEQAENLADFADVFASGLEAEAELIEFVEYRFSPDAEFLEVFFENALLFLEPEQLPELAAKFGDDAIREQIRQNRLVLASPTGDPRTELVQNDPLELMPFFMNRLMGNRGAFSVDLSAGYYHSRDGQSLLMLVKPTGHPQDLDFNEALFAAVTAAEQETREILADEMEEGASLGVQARYTGNYKIAIEQTELIREDISQNLFLSLFAVSALYWLCYRRFAALLYSTVPLLIGQALTFAVAFFALGQLNASSSAFTALLMGLGTDFTIVMYARYVEERRAGKTLVQATEAMVGETGLGVFTGAITSAGTFFAMCISRFRGLFDLGFLIGTGILLCAVAIIFLLPAMITWNEGVRKRKVDSVKKLHLQSFGLEYLIPLCARYSKSAIVVIAAMTLGAGWLAWNLDLDDSIRSLRSGDSPAYQVREEISRTFDASGSYMMAIASGETQAEALERTAQIAERLQPFIDAGSISSYDSVLTYLPARAKQDAIITALQERGDDAFDAERVRETFLSSLDDVGFRREAFGDYTRRMERFLSVERPLELTDLQGRGMEQLLDRYIREDDEKGVRIVTYLFSNDPEWKRRPPDGLIEQLTGGDSNIIVTGTNVIGQELRRIFSRDAKQGVGVGLLIVFVLLVIDFRSLRLTLIAMAQLVSGVIMMLGLMKIIGMQLNYANAFVATMILGVGIDYSIHMVHRMNWSGGKVEEGLMETGKAVVLAALTNIAGFGTLWFGNYPALQSFGKVATFGSLTCLFTSLTLVPALMVVGRKDGEDARA